MAPTQAQSAVHRDSAIIVAIYNQKGGCGKTMTAMQLAGTLGRRGARVLVLDMDDQHTAVAWCAQASAIEGAEVFPATVIEFSNYQGRAFAAELAKHAQNYDFIVIDCPPAIKSREPWHALLVADVALVPTTPLGDNVWSAGKAFDLGCEAQKENERLKLFAVPSRVGRGTVYDVFLEQLRALASEYSIEIAPLQFSYLNAYPTSQAMGSVVTVTEPASKAAGEVNRFTDWVLKVTN